MSSTADHRPYEPDSTSASSSYPGVPSGERVLNPGERLGGFQVLQVIGAGGMAVVYKALQLSLNRPVALKILNSRFSRDAAFIQRFEQEAGALAALNHPNIVNIIDKGQAENLYYFVMEFVPGTSLDKAIIEGELTLTDYMIIIMGIRDALGYVHSRGIVHRDIKPANILLSDEGRVKVSDFGIAHIAWGDPKLQKSGKSQFGTSFYMSPEQAEQGKTVDARADIYALGVTFYKMFTREIPQGSFSGPAKLNTALPEDVDPIILKALQSNPSNRYQTVEEFCNDLLTVLWQHSGLADGAPGYAPPAQSGPGRTGPSSLSVTPLPIPGQALPAKPTSTFPSLQQSAAPPPVRPRGAPPSSTPIPPTAKEPPRAPAAGKAKAPAPAKPAKVKKAAAREEAGGKKVLMAVAVVLILAGLGGGGYFAYTRWQSQQGPSLSDLGVPGGQTGGSSQTDTGPKPDTGSATSPDSSAPPPPVAPAATPQPTPTGPVGQQLIAIPAGPVRVGDANSHWASPPATINLPAFQIEKYEVTNGMYLQFVKATGYRPPPYWKNGTFPVGHENLPVVEVSLADAQAYAQWAERDIPTEEQWERAARGLNGWNYPWGQEWKEGAANIRTGRLLPVNSPGWRDITWEAAGEGCHFMAGNVMEWTKSRFAPYPGGESPPPGAGPGSIVVRGGAFVFRTRDRINPIFLARAGSRGFVTDSKVRLDNLGFRCVVNTP